MSENARNAVAEALQDFSPIGCCGIDDDLAAKMADAAILAYEQHRGKQEPVGFHYRHRKTGVEKILPVAERMADLPFNRENWEETALGRLGGESVNVEAIRRLISTAKLLYANAEGCAVNHHAVDYEKQGLPRWLTDCAAEIKVAVATLSPSPDHTGEKALDDDHLIDNAATASQNLSLVDDEVTREAIKLNVCEPLRRASPQPADVGALREVIRAAEYYIDRLYKAHSGQVRVTDLDEAEAAWERALAPSGGGE